jgi:hypothetical protein
MVKLNHSTVTLIKYLNQELKQLLLQLGVLLVVIFRATTSLFLSHSLLQLIKGHHLVHGLMLEKHLVKFDNLNVVS